jgi:hypothetical protein
LHTPPVPPSQLSDLATSLKPRLSGRKIGDDTGWWFTHTRHQFERPYISTTVTSVYVPTGTRQDLVVGREAAGPRDLVVEVVAGDAREVGVADLDPLIRPARALAQAADADRARGVTVENVERIELGDTRRDPVPVPWDSHRGIRVARGVAASERACRTGAEGDCRDGCTKK